LEGQQIKQAELTLSEAEREAVEERQAEREELIR